MKSFASVLMGLAFVLLLGCSHPGGTRMSGDVVTVSVGQQVMDRPEKLKALRVELLYQFTNVYLNNIDLPPSVKIDIVITGFRIGWGRDHMTLHVTVSDKGKELRSFNKTETTGRSSQVERLTKALAKHVYAEVRGMKLQ